MMGKLIANANAKFLVVGLMTLTLKSTLAQQNVVRDTGTVEFFRMINDFTDRADTPGNLERTGAFTLTSDRRSVVECGGIYKRLQSEISSPGFSSEGYPGNLHCEYTFKSPFVCSSQYHFQFLEFALEPSRNCSKDRLAIGEEEVLCGTVIGSKLYDAPGGVLRMKFVTDGWGTGRGFRILVTRQPCDSDDNEAAESSTAYTLYTTIQVADDNDGDLESSTEEDRNSATEVSVGGSNANRKGIVSSRQDIPPEFNPGGNGYLPPPTSVTPTYPPVTYPPATYPPASYPCPAPCYPPWGCPSPNYPSVPSSPPRVPCDPRYQSCSPVYPNYPSYPQQPLPPTSTCPTNHCVPGQGGYPQYPQYPSSYYPGYPSSGGTEGTTSLGGPPPGYEPVKSESRPEFAEPTTERVQPAPEPVDPESQVTFTPGVCCRNVLSQRRFYLSSANFPSQTTGYQDCMVRVQRFSPQTCRLVIGFKFFLLGHDQPYPGCPGGFVEVDGRRFCGCRTGQIYRTVDFGPYAIKTIRVQTQPGRFPSVQGFVLDITQEDCLPGVPLKRSDTERLVHGSRWVPSSTSFEMGRVEGRVLTVPVQTVESTNTTRTTTHQMYFYNLDETQPIAWPRETQSSQVQQNRPIRSDLQRFVQPMYPQGLPNRCLFTIADWLRLKLDWLWVFKPICLA